MGEIITLGVAPVKRSFLSMEAAKEQKDQFMAVIRNLKPDLLKIVDIDDLCENGIASQADVVPRAVKKFKDAGIDALFVPFCDFGEETVAAGIASAFRLPTLVWGPRDEKPNTDAARGRDTQCGMFAATKVLRSHGVQYSYIYNVATADPAFAEGFLNFLRFAAIIRDLSKLRILKIGDRPASFLSVMANDLDLVNRFRITTVPASPSSLTGHAIRLIEENDPELQPYCADLKARFHPITTMPPFPGMPEVKLEDNLKKAAALKLAIGRTMKEQNCSVAAFECWSAFSFGFGVCPCFAIGDLTDEGFPMACECDVNGAVTMAILRACALYESSCFLADLTIRHPQNDNAELLWHCGPFPYSLRAPDSKPGLNNWQEPFELKQGELTLCRFDEAGGAYSLFAGEGHTTTGPETTGTYVWLEVGNWKRWEEKLMFGPYIHHVGGIYGKYLPVLREVARYLHIPFDNAHEQGTYSL
jgi:L-fucose isomerase-like protein